MNGAPILLRILDALHAAHLEAILIGNAGAAVQGAPVTTNDFDFLYRRSQLEKVKEFARQLGASAAAPYYPISGMIRVIGTKPPVQVDMIITAHGVRSFESLRSRASRIRLGGSVLLVASLSDIIKSKRSAGRPKDLAVLPVLEATLREKEGK